MEASRWERLEELFGTAMELPASERLSGVQSLTDDDADLREELASLIAVVPHADVTIDRLRARIVGPDDASRSLAQAPSLAYERPDGWLGRRIGRYRIVEHIGTGGMGVIYRADDELLGRPVALKFLAPTLGWEDGAKERLLREARAAGAIDHPNVCTIYEVGEDEAGHLFIVMPAYEGEPLQERIARGPIGDEEALSISRAVARALAVAHDRGIVHGDVKPANVFLTRDGGVKLLDFGLARVRASRTAPPDGGGTTRYMSPEQVAGRPPDARSDVWMLGATIAAMIDGELGAQARRGSTPVRGGLQGVAAHATAQDPHLRPADGGALYAELESLRWRPPLPGTHVARPRRRALGRIALATVAVLLGAAALVREFAAAGPPPAVRHVLWVDDNPENNTEVIDRLESMGVGVTLARSTEEALALWVPEMGLVVSDMGRYEGDGGAYVERAGFDLFESLTARDSTVRVAFCTSFRAATTYGEEARARGALEVLSDCERVTDLVRIVD